MDITFKGKRVDNGEWENGHYVTDGTEHWIIDSHGTGSYEWIEVDPATVEIVTPMYKAAPAMYEALNEIISGPTSFFVSMPKHLRDAAKDALALAEGRQPE